jgi:acetyl-CoA carboxylase carboxyl transferase subunit alpha
MIIGHQKGINTKMRQIRNFGWPIRKATAKRSADETGGKIQKTVITLIDTPGAYPVWRRRKGQGEAIARNIFEMLRLKVPVICVIIGEGASGGALGIGAGDRGVYDAKYLVYRHLTGKLQQHTLAQLGQ